MKPSPSLITRFRPLSVGLILGALPCISSAQTIPVTDGLMVWLSADAVNPADPAQVDGSGNVQQWNDLSGNDHHASNATESERPAYIAGAMNGKPVLRFTEAMSSKLFLGDLSTSFWATPPVDPSPTAANSGMLGAAVDGTYMNIPTRGVAGALVEDSDTATTFNGSTQYVEIPYSADLNPPQGQPWTAEIWAKSNALGVLPPFSSGTPGNVTNRQGWVVYFFNNDLSFRAYTNNGANATINGGSGLTIPGLITPNTWYHLVVTCDGTDFRIYLDGVEIGSTPTVGPNGTYSPGTTGTALGFRLGAGNYFNGTLDEAAFYTTALSQSRIQAHYQNGTNDPARSQSYDLEIAVDSPVAHYKLNEPASPVASATVFAVAAPDNDGRYNLFGNRANDDRWVANNWTESSPGSFRTNRAAFGAAGYAAWPQSGAHLYSLESGPTQYRFVLNGDQNPALSTTGAYNSGAGADWTIGDSAASNDQRLNGDIAELILFNRVLTPLEADQVGGYLSEKYGLQTAYPPTNLTVTLTNPDDGLGYPNNTALEASATVTAGSIDGGEGPYTVEFWVDGTLEGTDTTEPYSLDLGILSDGSHEIYVKVTDSSPTPLTATSATHSFTVVPAIATTTTLTPSANPSTYGSGTLTATVVAANSSPLTGGTVQFTDGGEPLGEPVTVDTATGEASYTINLLGAGTHEVTATYSGFDGRTASSGSISQVVEKAVLTVAANDVFRATGMPNLDPLPYKITGYQNGEDLASSGVTGEPFLSTSADSASPAGDFDIVCATGTLEATNYSFALVNGTLTVADVPDTFSINFFVGPDWPYGGLTTDEQKENVQVHPWMAAGHDDWLTSGWENYLVPWAPSGPQTPVALTSNKGSTTTFQLKDCRNGWTYDGPRATLLDDGNGNMMDAHVNSTFDPGDGSNKFDMEVTDIPFAVYDVIFYLGASRPQFGDGKGVIVFNGGSERAFTLKSGAFDGTFTEMVDETTPGNYIIFKGVTGSSFTTQTWGTGNVGNSAGFVHLGPHGIQIRSAVTDYGSWAENYPGADLADPDGDLDGDGVSNDDERLFGLNPTDPASVNPISVPFDPEAGTLSFTRRDDALTEKFSRVEISTDLMAWSEDPNAQLVAGTPDEDLIETVAVQLDTDLLGESRLFARVVQDDGILLSSDFDEDGGGFTVIDHSGGTGSLWASGPPNSSGLGGSVLSGVGGSAGCWGTDLGPALPADPGGAYANGSDTSLVSPVIDLTNVPNAVLSFAEAIDIADGDTLVINLIEADISGGINVIGAPLHTSTPDSNILAADWSTVSDIAVTGGQPVRIEWRFTGNNSDGSYIGGYIDKVVVKRVLQP